MGGRLGIFFQPPTQPFLGPQAADKVMVAFAVGTFRI